MLEEASRDAVEDGLREALEEGGEGANNDKERDGGQPSPKPAEAGNNHDNNL